MPHEENRSPVIIYSIGCQNLISQTVYNILATMLCTNRRFPAFQPYKISFIFNITGDIKPQKFLSFFLNALYKLSGEFDKQLLLICVILASIHTIIIIVLISIIDSQADRGVL